jgi:hypothetical protein
VTLPRWLIVLVLCVSACPVLGQPRPASVAVPFARSVDALHSPGREVTITLLTMGDGDRVWEMFGHTAIWIRNDLTGRDTVFNWGVFDNTQPRFILHFLRGLNLYQMGGDSMAGVMNYYRYFNRTVVAQELDLTTAQKDSLLQLIRVNAQPQNISYRYDYFRDNCATRPRDMLDQVLGGQLREHAIRIADHSYRWHALTHMQRNKLLVIGVDIGLGEPSDKPITKWEAMFLPAELHDVIATMDVRGSSGVSHSLVRSDRVWFQAMRPREPNGPPNLSLPLLAIGLVLASLCLFVGVRAVNGGMGIRLAAATLFAAWSLIAGLLGLVLTLLWSATDHTFAYRNENLLIFNPLWLVAVVMLPMTFLSGRAARATSILTLILAALCGAALVGHFVQFSSQANLAIIALALPPSLAIAVAAWQERRSAKALS